MKKRPKVLTPPRENLGVLKRIKKKPESVQLLSLKKLPIQPKPASCQTE